MTKKKLIRMLVLFEIVLVIVMFAVVMGYIERRGGWFYYGERKWQGIESVISSIREEIDFMQDLQKKVLENHDTPAALIEEEE